MKPVPNSYHSILQMKHVILKSVPRQNGAKKRASKTYLSAYSVLFHSDKFGIPSPSDFRTVQSVVHVTSRTFHY